ncbi:hypothetical protein DL93DRAFT_786779 [Clavulina sp. PMI_390]|nr:hypothetical protein DL93DRAFT_786779 [Clavulina sp. PMI_390]
MPVCDPPKKGRGTMQDDESPALAFSGDFCALKMVLTSQRIDSRHTSSIITSNPRESVPTHFLPTLAAAVPTTPTSTPETFTSIEVSMMARSFISSTPSAECRAEVSSDSDIRLTDCTISGRSQWRLAPPAWRMVLSPSSECRQPTRTLRYHMRKNSMLIPDILTGWGVRSHSYLCCVMIRNKKRPSASFRGFL